MGTAKLCQEYAQEPLKNFLYKLGILHDIGKYQASFQERISGNDSIHVEHSICGAHEVEFTPYHSNILKLVAKLCIAGHHFGIPDVGFPTDTVEMPTLEGRLKRKPKNDYSAYKKELGAEISNGISDEPDILEFLKKDCENQNEFIDKFSFFIRYCFSCLTDADTIDTVTFCNDKKCETLPSDFEKCLEKINKDLQSFVCTTKLQETRSLIQKQVFDKTEKDSDIYLMNMPTGSGKTLCSLKFALERAIKENKKRIIYIIPYNSIIDQTAEEFTQRIGEFANILRHQSTFDYSKKGLGKNDDIDVDKDDKNLFEIATENWDAQLIITTAVQFFESVYSNKKKKLRKFHNMANSILVFDEAHLMPTQYLAPCLEAISYITKYLDSEAIFLTATMPNFRKLINKYAIKNTEILDLIEDKSHFKAFKKCRFNYIGELSFENLVLASSSAPSCLIVVNTRKTAKKIFEMVTGKKYHLSTYMTSTDRKRVISTIKSELAKLRQTFKNPNDVPEDKKITVVSTSLIEAGVDLDFYTVFRELAGIDSILQAGGRCNREGNRAIADVAIFRLEGQKYTQDKHEITSSAVEKYNDISCPESIEYYYDQLYFSQSANIEKNCIHNFCSGALTIALKEYAEKFEFIPQNTISIIVGEDNESKKLIKQLQYTGKTNMKKLQQYACTVYRYEFEGLLTQGVLDDYGSGVWCLTNNNYYNKETGISFEPTDYII